MSVQSNSVLPCPLASCRLVTGSVSLVDVRDLGHKRIVRVGVCEHRANGEQHYEWLEIVCVADSERCDLAHL